MPYAQLADRPPRLPGGLRNDDLLVLEVHAARHGHDLEERGHLRAQDERRHLLAGRRVRLDDAVRAGSSQLLGHVRLGGARNDQQVRPDRSRGQRDVEVVDVRVRRRDEALRVRDAGRLEILVVRPVALDVQGTVLAGALDRLLVEVEHDVADARLAELLAHAAADPSVAADDVVLGELLDRPLPPSFGHCPGEDSTRDPLDQDRRDEGKDSQSGEDEDDRDQARRIVLRNGVEAGQRARDDRAVERLDPPFVREVVEKQRPAGDDAHGGAERERNAPRRVGVVHGYIVGAWRTRASSGS